MKLSLVVLILAAFCPLPFAEGSEEDALVDIIQVAKQAVRQSPGPKVEPPPVPDAVSPNTLVLSPREEPDWSPRRYSRPPPL